MSSQQQLVGWPPPLTGRLVMRLRGSQRARAMAALALGCGIPLSGFTPFNHAADLLSIQRSPALVVLMPSVVLAVIALLLSRAFPARAFRRRASMVAAPSSFTMTANRKPWSRLSK